MAKVKMSAGIRPSKLLGRILDESDVRAHHIARLRTGDLQYFTTRELDETIELEIREIFAGHSKNDKIAFISLLRNNRKEES